MSSHLTLVLAALASVPTATDAYWLREPAGPTRLQVLRDELSSRTGTVESKCGTLVRGE